ncbi:hypothetical protein KZO01_09430 [Kurthia zopfii]|uniref:Adenosylcobinamide kinase n=1 Tax=Kurthia zopfii TaxID=1650 RepID=A0A8B4Q5X4_9BACL|nr:bifunctional adenosylcobinamide kinase/adenosylcobinamide-phosphate guanylyltransferase [Kurthia zopfii]PWI22350.1 cobinamide kinase [Kurthia zopfii]TDR38313.1 adenosylcobinamide kinase /adenosylcobinamide-phosphate guanylyltransferase [Kurthia zopfii]GEK30634.1 hypothetical protein KZO01_09430 [Kurthia zopfii]STX08648.1 Adenosylcobinamide kinase [Kurthia zopfii]
MDQAEWLFITGGVRSGKSHFAEKKVDEIADQQNRMRYYIASGVAFDSEMKKRIERHQIDRQQQQWITLEQPTNLAQLSTKISSEAVVLWDCATTWLTNELYVEVDGKMQWQNESAFQTMLESTKSTLRALHERGIPLIIVSNEVLDEQSYASEEVAFYRQQLGLFHQWLVGESTTAIEMTYTIPYYWKGSEK